MKCLTHNSEAVAICTYCGRALCADCGAGFSVAPYKISDGERTDPHVAQRMVCSDKCAAAIASNDQAMQLILEKSLQSARANAFYAYLCGGLSAAGAVGAWFYLHVPFLIWFTAGCSIVFIASGIWHGRVAQRKNL
jgi:hypothetical protein